MNDRQRKLLKRVCRASKRLNVLLASTEDAAYRQRDDTADTIYEPGWLAEALAAESLRVTEELRADLKKLKRSARESAPEQSQARAG